MRKHAGLVLAFLALSSCQTANQGWPFPPDGYVCTAQRRVGDWQMRAMRFVRVDPALEGWDEVHWDLLRTSPGIAPSIEWTLTAAGREVRAFRLFYLTSTKPRGKVRVEIWRAAGTGREAALIGGTEYYRSYRERRDALYRRQGDFNWAQLQTLVGERTSLLVVLTGQDGQVRGSVPFDPAWLTPPEGIAAEARSDLDAMAADYRNRCTPEPPIIVT